MPDMKRKYFAQFTALIIAVAMCLSCVSCGTEKESPDSRLAASLLEEMTLKEKIGQLFLLHGTASIEKNVAAAEEYGIGGILLFSDFFEERMPEEVCNDTAALQKASKYRMFIGVDEEGRDVTRISAFEKYRNEPFSSPRELMKDGGIELVKQDTAEKCELLKQLGINLNLAPVSDVSTDECDFIYGRSAGDADDAADYVKAYIEESNLHSVGSCLKHFPGYGNNDDTHTGVAVDKRKYESFRESDFIPVTAGIDADVGMVLFSHNIVSCMDAKRPASLSEEVHRVLREELGFDGVIITDDLDMDAIATQFEAGEAAVLAIESGNDMIIASKIAVQYKAIFSAIRSGRISEERINESVKRVLEYKIKLGIIT